MTDGATDSVGEPTTAPTRVLHLLTFDDWGGTEVQVAGLVLRSDPARCRQAVATLAPPGPLSEHLRAGGVPTTSLAGPGGIAGAIARLARLLRRKRHDILSAYGFRAGLVARAAALLGGRPAIVIGVRGLHFSSSEDPDGRRTRFVLTVERALQRTVDRYDANSQGARDFLVGRGFRPARFVVIANGVDAARFAPAAHAPTPQPRIVCVARFVPVKLHDVLVHALARLARDGIAFECELVGYGPTSGAVRALVAELGVEDRVTFAGRLSQDETAGRLAAADVFALTSLWEGMPGSIMEAMASGLPVVATDVNGCNELVVPGVTGLLVPPGDPAALADALRTLLADPELRMHMGDAGRTRMEGEFSVAGMVERKLALYDDVARAHRARRRGARAAAPQLSG